MPHMILIKSLVAICYLVRPIGNKDKLLLLLVIMVFFDPSFLTINAASTLKYFHVLYF